MKVLDVLWFSGKDCIGIVATKNSIEEVKFYIGKGNGYDEDEDAQDIANYGNKISQEIVQEFFNKYLKK